MELPNGAPELIEDLYEYPWRNRPWSTDATSGPECITDSVIRAHGGFIAELHRRLTELEDQVQYMKDRQSY